MKIKKKCIVIFVSSAMILSMFSYEIAYLTFAKDTTAVSQEEIIDHRDYIGDLSSLPYSEGGLGLFQEEDSYTIKLGDTNIPDNDKKINIEKLRILEGNFKEGSDKILKIDEGVLLPDLSEAIFKGYKCDIEIADTIDTSNVISMKELFMDTEKANPDVSSWDVSNVQNFCMMFESAKEANPDVSNWNISRASSMYRMFRDTEKANPDVSDWNVSNVSNMYAMFCGAKLANPDVSKWETNKLRYSNAMFRNAKNANPDVSNWITSEVVNIDVMFEGAEVASPDVSKWDTSKVESMKSVFKGAKLANPDVSKWNTSKVTSIDSMFEGAEVASPEVAEWDTSKVESMKSVFKGAKLANPDVSKWNTSKVTSVDSMFEGAEVASPDVSKWDTSKVESMKSVFKGAKLANPDVSKWNTSEVTSMYSMFEGAEAADPKVDEWDTSKVTNMSSMFSKNNIANPNVSNWNVEKVEQMYAMFRDTEKADPDVSKWKTNSLKNTSLMFNETKMANPDVSNWNMSKVEDMYGMFRNTEKADPDVSKWDTSSVENMYSLFCSAKEANPDVSKWNIEKVIYINAMFRDTEKADPDVSKWDTSSAENMESMFCGAKLANPDVSKWNTSKVKSMKAMFKNSKLANPDVSDWDTVKVEDMERMFENAENAKPDVSKWSVKNLSNAELIFSGTAAKELDIRNMRSLNGISEGKRTIYNNKNLEKIVFSYEEENKNYFPLESIYMNAANYKLYKIVDEEAYNKNSDKGKLKIKEFSLALEKNASAESNISIASKINEAVENELENSTDRKVSFEIKLDEIGTENGGNGGNGGGTTSKNYAILASGDNYTDALVSSVLANEKKGPILLTEKNKISKETLREIDRLALDELIVVGGEESISKNIFEGLKNKDYTVRRISGQNRYETAKKIGQEVRLTSKNTDLAILVDGRNFPDAISVSDLASERRVPILLTEADLLNKETKEALRDWNIKKLTIAGAEKSVSKNIEEKLKASIKDVDRIAGKDRYETSYLVAKELRSKIDNKNNMILVDGRNFPDGITVASLSSKYKSPILLTTGDKIHPRVAKAINDWSIENILITGGYKSVSKDIEDGLNVEKIYRVSGNNRYNTAIEISKKYTNSIKLDNK